MRQWWSIAHGGESGVLLAILLLSGWGTARAQLISPGALSQAHSDLEGIRNCTACHALRNKGIDNSRCLNCHTPLQARIAAGRGYHARIAEQNCADCHKEHFGADFDLVRFDTTQFNHTDTGYRLTGVHTEAACRTCHQPSNIVAADVRAFKGQHGALDATYLGLPTRCMNCHEQESPHGGQFANEDCASCHEAETWEKAPKFDHGTARFALTGRHRQVDCAQCHPEETGPDGSTFTRFEGVDFTTCSSCHQDTHQGAFGANCQGCHTPNDWHQVRNLSEDRFDHGATGYALVGRHAELACASCHTRPARHDDAIAIAFVRGTEQHTYPRIQVTDCPSCHTDFHDGAFADEEGSAVCNDCHTQSGWVPVTFDLAQHNEQARFKLTGAHVATPCTACHHPNAGPPVFQFDNLDCQACHAAISPHAGEFADGAGTTHCADCHETDAWTIGARFDHARTDFPLTGRHVDVTCSACHTAQPTADGQRVPRYRNLSTACVSCHDDSHRGQFGDRTCEACHTTSGFDRAAETFDHSQTRFPLTGAHTQAACGQCHRIETDAAGTSFVRYRPLGIACKDCHSDE